MATTSTTPQTVPPSSEGCIPGETTKKSLTAPEAELQRNERSFQPCLEFLMPVYLLPFVFSDKEGTCIYCILLTVVGLTGGLLPPAVAAVLPIAILPLGDVYDTDGLAAQYFGPHVLTASVLFALAFLGDETTVFFRLCLHVIQRCALRLRPLLLYLQLLVLVLSLLLPSTIIVIFSHVFIDRFVTTVHDEIVGGDQRSVVRIQTASSNYSDEARGRRWRRGSRVTKPERRARSVSMVSEAASEASGNSSSVKQSGMRMLPPTPTHGRDEKKTPRKTYSGAFSRPRIEDGRDNEWSRYAPVCRNLSLSSQNKPPPSSILKRNPNTPPPSPVTTSSCSGLSPVASPLVASSRTKDPEGRNGAPSARTSPQPPPRKEVGHDARVESPAVMTTHTESSFTPSPLLGPQPNQAPASGSLTCAGAADASAALSGGFESSMLLRSCSNGGAMAKRPKRDEPAPSSTKLRSTAQHSRDRDAVTPRKPQHRHHALSANNKRQPEQAACLSLDTTADTRQESRRTSAPKSETVPPPPETTAPTSDPMPEPVQEKATACQAQSETKPEVRGVLKKRSPPNQPDNARRSWSLSSRSLKPIAPLENEDFGPRAPCQLPAAGSEPPTTGRCSLSAQRPSMSDMKSPTEKGSSSLTPEQPTLYLRVRNLTTAVRPAFIASAAYTAIFGNMASFNTLSARKAVLVTLGCHDEQCPVSWSRWLVVSLPVMVTCCAISWTSIYWTSLVSWENSIDEQTHRDMSKSAKDRHQNMKRHTIREALLFYWLIGVPIASSAYAAQHPGRYLEGPFLGLTLLVLSTAPGPVWRRCWSLCLLCWRNICSRMPWDIILMIGSVMALGRTVERYRLVEVGLAKLDDHFWAQRSAKSSQFILVSVAAVLSEVVVGDSLARSMATTVVRVAVVTETPLSFYVVPLAYGVLIKCTAVLVIFISMNTIGLLVFQGDQPRAVRAIGVICNATDTDRATL
ncbi:uncharacterized protein [Dermacentor albipictus]|uniref:uncharacterized protein isoform X2 n=1 Tax=Dermacentor albipictus TaxID=60249 RepID=UPI0031FDC47F